jgi:hypothetical protein
MVWYGVEVSLSPNLFGGLHQELSCLGHFSRQAPEIGRAVEDARGLFLVALLLA